MDPLSITSTVITFIDVVRQIQASLNKVTQNRRRTRQLCDEVLQSLSDLKTLCSKRETELILSEELNYSMQRLKSQLSRVLDFCQKAHSTDGQPTRFQRLKHVFNAWRKVDDIEEEIRRLKEHVQFCLLQFISITIVRVDLTAARTERAIQALRTQTPQVLPAESCRTSTHFAQEIWHIPCDINKQYLHLQVRAIEEALMKRPSLSSTQPDAQCLPFFSFRNKPARIPTASRSLAIGALQVLDLLERNPEATPEIARNLFSFGESLFEWSLESDALMIKTWTVQLYRYLVYDCDLSTFARPLSVALISLSRSMLIPRLALAASQEAVAVYRTYVWSSDDLVYAICFANALQRLAECLYAEGEIEDSIYYLNEALEILQRPFLTEAPRQSSAELTTKVAQLDFSPSEVGGMASAMQLQEACILGHTAYYFSSMGHFTKGVSIGRKALSLLEVLLVDVDIDIVSEYRSWLHALLHTWVPIIPQPGAVYPTESSCLATVENNGRVRRLQCPRHE